MSGRSDRRQAQASRGRGGRRAPGGFTLLEVMVAIGILGIIVGLIYGSIAMTADSKDEVEQGNDIYQQVRWALDKMDQDITSAFVSKNQQTHSLFYAVHRKGSEGLPMDEVHFTSFNHVKYNPSARESDQAEISYFVMENPDNGLMTLYRREDAKMDANNLDGGDFYDLVENVLSLSLRYYDGEQWVEEWDTRDPAKQGAANAGGETADATPTPDSEIQNQTDTMINTLPLAVEVGILVAAPRDMQLAFNTKIRLVLSTIDLSMMDEDQGSQSGSGSSGSGASGSGSSGSGSSGSGSSGSGKSGDKSSGGLSTGGF